MCFYCCSDSNCEFDDECTLSASKLLSSTQGEEDMEISSTGDCGNIEVVVPYGLEREEWKKRLIADLNEKFDQINTVQQGSSSC